MRKLEEILEIKKVTIADEDFEIDVGEYLKVDPSRLEHEFAVHIKRVALICYAYEQAYSHVQKLEALLDRCYGLCDERARASLSMDLNGKKPTEAMVENAVKLAVEYQTLENELLAAKNSLGLLKALRDAILQRKDVLVGLGANLRQERAAEMLHINK